MRAELRQRILVYNREMADRREKAEDLQIIVNEMSRLPYGQLKKLLTGEVLEVLEKYGLEVRSDE